MGFDGGIIFLALGSLGIGTCTPRGLLVSASLEGCRFGGSRINIINLEKATEKVNSEPFSPGQIITEKSASFPLLRSYPAVKDPEDITGGYILTIEKKHRMKDDY